MNRFARVLLAVLLPVLLVLGALRLLVTDAYLRFEYGKATFPPDPYGFSTAERLALASANFRYVREAQPIEALATPSRDGVALYNERELRHMQDVQAVYRSVMAVGALAALASLVLAGVLSVRRELRPAVAWALRWGGGLAVALVGAVGLLALVAWRLWFTTFHRVFFAPGSWMFSYEDTLIRLFPERFWFDAALTIAGLSVFGGLGLALLGRRLDARVPIPPARSRPATSHP